MSNKYSEQSQHEIQPDRENRPISDGVSEKLAIEELSEDTHELSGKHSNAIAGGLSRYELSDYQLEAFAGGRVTSIIHVIGFEN
jgi:hypothetical protein